MRKVNKHFIISILLTYNFLFITASLNCVKLEDMIKHTFYPLRHCQRSNQSVVGYKMAANVEDCAEYSRLVQGLAFNFSPETRSKTNLFQKVLEEQGKVLLKIYYSLELVRTNSNKFCNITFIKSTIQLN